MARVDEVPYGGEIWLPFRCIARYQLPAPIIGHHRVIMAHWGEKDAAIWAAYLARRRMHRNPPP